MAEINNENGFKTNVIFRLDIPPVSHEAWGTKSGNIVSSIQALYSDIKTSVVNSTVFSPDDTASQLKSFRVIMLQEHVLTLQDVIIRINYNNIGFETLVYTSFEKLEDLIKKVLSIFIKELEVKNIFRLGLRYINLFNLNSLQLDYKDCFSSDVIAFLDGYKTSEELRRNLQAVVLNKDDFSLTINFGLFNSYFPAVIKQKEFVLDYDACVVNFYSDDVDKYLNEAYTQVIKIEFNKHIRDVLVQKGICI